MNGQETSQLPEPVEPKRHIGLIVLAIGILALIAAVVVFVARQPGEPAEAEEAAALKANVVFASHIDENFAYLIQPNAEYTAGNPVNVYAELEGFAQEGNSESGFSVDVAEDLEIKNSDGKTMFGEKEFSSHRNVYTEKIPSIKFRNTVPALEWKPGRYTLRAVFNDNLGHASITKTMEFFIKAREELGSALNFIGPVFAETISDDYNITLKPNSIYAPGDTVYAYGRVANLEQPAFGGKYSAKFAEDIYVLDYNGNILLSQTNHIRVDEMNDAVKPAYNVKSSVPTAGAPVGNYILRVVLRDLNSGMNITKEGYFWLR